MEVPLPRFSVIVPAYQVQAYLPECLESVLAQDWPDFELIAVDDGSPDGCGALIRDFARRDHRVRPVHLPANTGLGPARNAGLAHARGDYLLFLDGDDTLTPGALRAVADRLAATGDPEVLVYDYARTTWSGTAARNQYAQLLAEDGPDVFRLADRPALLRLLMVVWNKAYRRDFVQRQGLAFPPGYYEDTPWTFPALATAESIAVLDRVCVHYRQRRRGNILGTTGRGHFDIFDQYDRVFAFLDSRPELARWRPLLVRRMTDHLTAVYTARGRLPRDSRAEFFRRAAAHCRRYRCAAPAPAAVDSAPPRLAVRVRHGLVRLGWHRPFRLLAGAQRLRRAVARRARWVLRRTRRAALGLHYRFQRRLPVRPDHAVFTAHWHRGYAGDPAAIEAKLRELCPGMRTAWVAAPGYEDTVPPDVRWLQPGTAAYWTALARSKYLVNNVHFDGRLAKRPGQVLLQTHRGTPLKHMGLDLQERPAAARGTDFARLLRGVDNWDYSLSANRHATLTWERVYPADYTTLEYGQPRTDRFLRATAQDVLRIRTELGIPPSATAILYAPTHRDYRRSRRPALDPHRLLRELGPDFVVLVRPHFSSLEGPRYAADVPPAPPGDGVIDVSGHPCVEDLCLASDALVTDYSSLMFDYVNLDRPVVVLTDDWEAYREARGTYFDLLRHPPGPVARNEEELIDIFASPAWHGPRSAALRATFRSLFCPYDDGHAAERVVRRVFLGDEGSPPDAVPLHERRPAPSPERARRLAVPQPVPGPTTAHASHVAIDSPDRLETDRT